MATIEHVPPAEAQFKLHISASEAKALHTVLRSVGGDRDLSPRGKTASILKALESAGVDYHPFGALKGTVWFESGDKRAGWGSGL